MTKPVLTGLSVSPETLRKHAEKLFKENTSAKDKAHLWYTRKGTKYQITIDQIAYALQECIKEYLIDNILDYDSYEHVWSLSSFNSYIEEYADLIHNDLYPEI